MDDESYSSIYDTIQKHREYEFPDQTGENEDHFYDAVHKDLRLGNNLYDTKLEDHEYDSVSICVSRDEKNSLASSQPEAGEYLLPDAVCPEAQKPQLGEPRKDGDISMEELYSPTQDLESFPEGPQENGSVMMEDLPSPSSYTLRHSKAFSTNKDFPTCYYDGFEENEAASEKPEIFLFVKVRAASGRHTCPCRCVAGVLFCFEGQGKLYSVMVLEPHSRPCYFGMYSGLLTITRM
jgi:hypothetical protein